ncbi:MAG TPA: GGDEF domain-containing protein, partial [Thermovirgaceae bacterium]|nr:GGDEF domain-containing protein [Thermovirgaceae bacterium]
GDRALLQIATSISDSIRSSDMAARWGGDEFILATPAPLEKAKGLAEKLRKLLEELDHDGFGPITGSFGISSFRNGDTIETLTGRADDLMYAVKRLGGNDIRSTP